MSYPKVRFVGYSRGSMVVRLGLGDAKMVGESAYKQIVVGAVFGGPKGDETFGGFGKGVPKGAAPAGGVPIVPPPTGAVPPNAPSVGPVVSAPKGAPPNAPPSASPVVGGPKGAPFGGVASKFDMGQEEKVRWYCAKGGPVRFSSPFSLDISRCCAFQLAPKG